MPEAGWYQDPHNSDQQRYWDGSTWTEHTHDAPFHMPEAPIQGQTYAGPGGQYPGFINNIGEWLGRSFSVLFANAMPLFILLLAGILPALAPYWGVWQVIKDVTLHFDGIDQDTGFPTDISTSGGSASAVGITVFVMLAALLFSAFLALTQSYMLHRGHVGKQARFAESLTAAAKGLPRYVGWWLLIVVGGLVAWVVVMELLSSLGALGALLVILLNLALIPVVVWLWVKLSFLSISAAVAPSGQSALRASTDRSKSVFWGVFGRLVLLAVITIFVSIAVQSIASPGLPDGLSTSSSGELLVNGTPLDEIAELRVADLIKVGNSTVVTLIISGLLTGAVGLYSRSGLAGLYADLNGPSEQHDDPGTESVAEVAGS